MNTHDESLPIELQSELVEEKRLVGTLLTRRLREVVQLNAFILSSLVVLIISAISIFVFNSSPELMDKLSAIEINIFQKGEVWRAFTAVFIHADLEHLLSNILLLWIFSYFINAYFGFLVFPLASFALATLANLIAIASYPSEVHLLGASGLVYVLGGFWLTLYPAIQRQYSFKNRLIRSLGIALILFAPSTFVPTVSYRTHAIGFALGVLFGLLYFAKNKKQIRSKERYQISWV